MKNLLPGVVLALVLLAGHSEAAGSLSESDYRYLRSEFGVAKDGFTLANLSAEDAKKLHALINEPLPVAAPMRRHYNVADFLFDVELRTCQQWELSHGNQSCPQVSDPSLVPGWQVAEQRCISCHLTGTTSAPSFFKLAQAGAVTEDRLRAALAGGHQMSPMTLSPQELADLARYINSLRITER